MEKLIQPPYIFNIDIQRLDNGFLLEVQKRVLVGIAPTFYRGAFGNLAAVHETIETLANLFIKGVADECDKKE